MKNKLEICEHNLNKERCSICSKSGDISDSGQAAGSVSSEVYYRLKGLYDWIQLAPKTLLADRAKLGEMVKCCMEPLKETKPNV